jgi:hypothetical protein
MLIGLPFTSNQKDLEFRKFVNLSLDQQEHVALPILPEWKKQDKGIIVRKSEIENPLLLVIKSDEASLMSKQGTFYHVGQVECESSCILIIHLYRDKNHAFMGGTITILDVLYFDNEHFMDTNYNEKMKQFRFLHSCIHLPKRYLFNRVQKGSKSDIYDAWCHC